MKRNIFIFFLLLLAAFSGCAPEKSRTVTIIAVNDLHGGIDNFPSLATLVESYRAQDPKGVLLVDAGDRWSGNPYVDLAERRGFPMIELQNALGVEVSTYGNHEFDFGVDALAERVREAKFPFICANIDSNNSPLPQPKPYAIFDVDGVRIALIGLITTARGGYPDGFVTNFGSIRFSHPIATALEYRSLRDSCHVLAGLTHIGFDMDSVLALQMPELDLIIGGHSHTMVSDDTRVNNTTIVQAGWRGRYATVITLNMLGHKLQGIESRMVKLDTVPPDPKFAAMVEKYKNRPDLEEEVGTIAAGLNKSGVMSMVSDMARLETGADMALYNWGGIRVDTLPAGPVRMVDVFAMEPFGNSLVMLRMTPEQIKQIILNKFNSAGKEGQNVDLYPSGLTYRIVTDGRGVGTDVVMRTSARLSPSGTYTVALSDYVAGAYDFSAAGTGEPTGKIVSATLIDYLRRNSPVRGDNTPRVTIER